MGRKDGTVGCVVGTVRGLVHRKVVGMVAAGNHLGPRATNATMRVRSVCETVSSQIRSVRPCVTFRIDVRNFGAGFGNVVDVNNGCGIIRRSKSCFHGDAFGHTHVGQREEKLEEEDEDVEE